MLPGPLLPRLPVGADRVPEIADAFVIGIAVLDNQSGDTVRMLERQPVADRCTIIHDIHRVLGGAELSEQRINDVGIVAEGIFELCVIGSIALAEARIVGAIIR